MLQPNYNRTDRHTPHEPLNWEFFAVPHRADPNYDVVVNLLARASDLGQLIGRFTLLSSFQADALLFYENKSLTPRRRTFGYLLAADLVRVIENPAPGGSRGGSSQNWYQLTPKGHRLWGHGRYRRIEYVQGEDHKVRVTEAYIAVLKASRDGLIEVVNLAVDPYAAVEVAGIQIDTDLYMVVGVPSTNTQWDLWVEVDLRTENVGQLKEKLRRYVHAFNHRADVPLEDFPKVLWLAKNEQRERELRRWISEIDAPRSLFRVELIDRFPALLLE